MTVSSPCTGQCRLNDEGNACLACLRSIGEIQAWGEMSDDARRAVLADLPNRPRLPR